MDLAILILALACVLRKTDGHFKQTYMWLTKTDLDLLLVR